MLVVVKHFDQRTTTVALTRIGNTAAVRAHLCRVDVHTVRTQCCRTLVRRNSEQIGLL
jgi:hypothetical protein